MGTWIGHTPGPWRIEGELTEGEDGIGQSGDSTLLIYGDGIYIGEIGADYGIHETEANAELIASAPELLADNKQLRKNIEGYIAIWDYLDPKGYARQEEKFVALLKEHGFDTGDD